MNYSVLLNPRRLAAAVRRRLIQRRTMIQAIRAGRQRFRDNPNFAPAMVPTYFVSRLSGGEDDSAILRRIISAYQKAKALQRSAGEAFNVSNEWTPIYERQLGNVMRALREGDIADLQRMYRNFFRDSCSAGLAGLPINIPNLFSGGRIKQKHREYILCDVLHRYDLWKKRTGGRYGTEALAAPLVGNPYGYTVDEVFIRAGGDYHHYYAHAIGELLGSSQKAQVVIELGGGFGGMAFYLLRDNPNLAYVDFDLPEGTALASYYLMKSLPNAPIYLFGECELSEETLQRPGVFMMPSFEIKNMPSSSVALSFNSYSLAEMSPATIRVYIDEIARITKRFFLHVNHYRNSVLSSDKFGVEDRGFKLVYRELAGWTSGINPDSDEMEYLYQK